MPTSIELFANNAQSSLAGAIANSDLTASLAPGTGALFPVPTGNEYFSITFVDALTGLINEIVYVTNVTGDVITMLRAQEGTTALAWLAGDLASNFITAGALRNFVQKSNAISGGTLGGVIAALVANGILSS